jgi:uncharacterized protein with GYD domain
MVQTTHTVEGLKGLIKEGGTKRRKAVKRLIEDLGGTLEAYYYAFGETDLYIVADMPDNVSTTAGSLISNVAGASKVKVTVLITPEEVDQATDLAKEKMAAYRPPGKE